MSAIYLDDLPVSPNVHLALSLAAIHILFFASFLLPGLYLAWSERLEGSIRTDRTPLWLGLPFAFFTVILCFLTYRYFAPARIYLGIYGALAAIVTGLRVVAGLAMASSDSVKEASVEPDRPDPQEHVSRGKDSREPRCRPRLLDALGSDTLMEIRGSSGRSWLPGSNFYEWVLRVEMVRADDNGFVAVASVSGGYIPWCGVSRRRVLRPPRAAEAKVYCTEKQGECTIAAMASQVKPQHGPYDEAIAISWQVTGDAIAIRVEATAGVEAKLLLELSDISGTIGGNAGVVELKGEVKAKVNRLNEAKAEATLDRTYLYRCEPV